MHRISSQVSARIPISGARYTVVNVTGSDAFLMIQASRWFLFVWIYLPNRSSRRRDAEASSMLKPKFPLALRLWKNFEIRSRCRHDYLKRQTPSIKYVLADHSPEVAIEQVSVRSLLVV